MPKKQIEKNIIPLVTIFGRTNVGKSTLFNCLTEKHQALVTDMEGTTRDSNLAQINWGGFDFELVDTGGIMDLDYLMSKTKKTEDIESKVQKQAVEYLKKSDLILFVVDNKSGLLPQDREMTLLLKKILPTLNNIILVVNKVDNYRQRPRGADFHKLAMGEPLMISAATGSGTGDLLDEIANKLKKLKFKINKVKKNRDDYEDDDDSDESENKTPKNDNGNINVCLMGKPNVGKSSLLNSILGYERVIVSSVPHTTREPQNTDINYNNRQIKIIDTAGISKKAQISSRKEMKNLEKLHFYGIAKSLGTLRRADIVIFVIDINEEITHQDAQIVEELVERKKSIIIMANKWDLLEERDTKKYTSYIYDHLPFILWAPIQFVSAKTGEKVNRVLDLILKISDERKTIIPDAELNTFLMKIIKIHKPSKAKGLRHPYIYEFKQIHSNPPRFKVRIGSKDTLHFSYVRFLENRIREKYGFLGTPINIEVTKNKTKHGSHAEKTDSRRKKRVFRNKKF